MDELNPTVREQEIYEEMELTPEMIKSIRTLCATCLRHFVEAKCSTVHRNCVIPAAERRAKTLIVTVPMLCFVGRCSVHTAEIA